MSLLNRKNHYEIVYSQKDYDKYQKIFENYENHQKSVILSDIDKYLKLLPNDNNDNLLAGISESKHKLAPKTMVIQRNNLHNMDKYNIGNYNEDNKVKSDIVNKKANNPNIINNIDLINGNKINDNNININQNQNRKNELNPKVKVQSNKNNNNNINNNQYERQNQNNNNIKNDIDNNIYQNTNKNHNINVNNINQYNSSNNQNKAKINPGQNNGYNNQNNYQPSRQNIQPHNNQNILQEQNAINNNIYNNQKGSQNNSDISNQLARQNNNNLQNNMIQNNKFINSKYSQNNNNNSNNLVNNQNNINKRNYKINQNENMNNKPNQKNEEIGLKTPGNGHSSKQSSNSNNQGFNNLNQFICKNCKTPLNITNLTLCQNCFKNEILNEVYSSYLQYLNQPDMPEELINANITITNFKNEKKTLNLDDALARYNHYFPNQNQKFDRKQMILELKKRLCVACLNDIKTYSFYELPCKCRICSLDHLNSYLSFFQDFKRGFFCRCKTNYDRHMMMELTLIKGLNNDINSRINYYFQKKLDSICCICAKTGNIRGYSNTLVCLEKPEYNRFLYSLKHYFCTNCTEVNRNKEFFCQICRIKHFWN
jgi:hypothetical protein